MKPSQLPRFHTCLFVLLALTLLPLKTVNAREWNKDESLVGDYTLPDPLRMEDGTLITTPEAWRQQRRPETLSLFRQHVYGAPPADLSTRITSEVIDERTDALGGLATRRLIQVRLADYPDFPGIQVMLYLPNSAQGPVPVFAGLSFWGNHAVSSETDLPISPRWMRANKENGIVNNRATEASRGVESSRWPLEMIVKRGYALATAYYGDIEPDHAEGWKDGLRAAVRSADQKDAAWKEGEWGAISAWAWGLSLILDCLETVPEVDAKHCAVIGHSRLGKTSLWAGAQDERFALVITNNSGEGGAALKYRYFGETPAIITQSFPHWFTATYKNYGPDPKTCPVDQHQAVALVAPRPVYVASAADDLWADPKGEFLAAKHAEPVYALFGKGGLTVAEQPPIDHPVGDFVGYHIRTGEHGVTDFDWTQYLGFADRHFSRK